MSILELSQIIFNLVSSLAVIVIAILLSIIAFDIIRFTKSIKKFIDGVNKESTELFGKINKFVENIFNLSFISNFFEKVSKKKKNKR